MKPVAVAGVLALLSCANGTPEVDDFDWATIEPSTSLNYTKCYDNHKCAKLSVPLDWLDETNEGRVVLAITARPAVVDETDPSFGGTIIVNPGGPSGSGVGFVIRAGETIQSTADGNKKYEILSFDPRGVGFTTPNSDCYRDEFARGSGLIEDRAMGPLDAGVDVVKRRLSRAKAFGRLCEGASAADDIRGFMSTASVARDMIAIVDKLDELRTESSASEDEQQRLELRSAKDLPRINYWGFSYGSILGNYLASMFPGRLGRVILEAVADVEDYHNATWALNLMDTQKVLLHFYETCYEAGSKCDLYKSTDKSLDDIRARLDAFLDELDESPIPYLSQSTVVSITRDDVLTTIFRPLYQPQRDFPRLATLLAEALDGNFTQLYSSLESPKAADSCPLKLPDTYTWGTDAQRAIACGDGLPQTNITIDEFQKHMGKLKEDSPDFGVPWSSIRLDCAGWRFRPKYNFAGPWTTPEADASLVEGKPAAPLLFVSSLNDTVTPLRNARVMSEGHPGSRVIVQNNAGHGTLYSPGKCREDLIKNYFETGEVPEEHETMCETECRPFQECPKSGVAAFGLGEKPGRWSPLGIN